MTSRTMKFDIFFFRILGEEYFSYTGHACFWKKNVFGVYEMVLRTYI